VVVDDGVIVDRHGRTSLPWLFAAGDVASRPMRTAPPPGAHRALEQHAPSGRGGRHDDARPAKHQPQRPYFWSDQYDVKLRCSAGLWWISRD